MDKLNMLYKNMFFLLLNAPLLVGRRLIHDNKQKLFWQKKYQRFPSSPSLCLCLSLSLSLYIYIYIYISIIRFS